MESLDLDYDRQTSFWVSWVDQWFKFGLTWVIGVSGCHARDIYLLRVSMNNPVVKVLGLQPLTLTAGLLVGTHYEGPVVKDRLRMFFLWSVTFLV